MRRAALVALVLGLGGCGSSRALPPAAEPAQAPVPTARPAGRVIGVGAGAEGVVADGPTGLVAVAVREPARLVLVRARTGKVVREVPLPAGARHLALAAPGGPVLVPAELANTLALAPLRGGRLRTVRVGLHPHDAAPADDGLLWVGNEKGDTVAVVDRSRPPRVVDRLPARVQPGGVAALGPRRIGVVTVASDELLIYDSARRALTGRIRAGAGPTHIVAGPDGKAYVADTRGDAVLVFATEPEPRVVGRLAAPGAPYGIALDAARDRLWITETARNRLIGYQLTTGRAHRRWSFPTVRQPNSVAVDPRTGRVFVASASDGTLELIDAPP